MTELVALVGAIIGSLIAFVLEQRRQSYREWRRAQLQMNAAIRMAESWNQPEIHLAYHSLWPKLEVLVNEVSLHLPNRESAQLQQLLEKLTDPSQHKKAGFSQLDGTALEYLRLSPTAAFDETERAKRFLVETLKQMRAIPFRFTPWDSPETGCCCGHC